VSLIVKLWQPSVLRCKTGIQVFVVSKLTPKPLVVNLSVEEENLAAIPFAVLERRVGKKVGKLELKGTKRLPDGREVAVTWQVQGNNDLGLPTEQDLDIFIALGVLTFQNNFEKTVSFTGRELAKIMNSRGVHGKFYNRLKLAMDRFIPLRFRAIAETDRQEEVKWLNVFQEASFSLDRTTGRCTGTVTWTDKIIRSMDSGFFRVLDASRYMELDGITAKHLYRYLAVAFEKSDLVIIDARKLVTQHLGILNPPKYLSRLMQTLEPAFDQLIRIQVMSGYHIVAAERWELALRRHPAYVPGNKELMRQVTAECPSMNRGRCERLLERAGFSSAAAEVYSAAATTRLELYGLERAARLLEAMKAEDVMPHVALNIIRKALDAGVDGPGREMLDWSEMGVEICRKKKESGQRLNSPAGLIVKLAKDPATRSKVVGQHDVQAWTERFRRREEAALRQEAEIEQRTLIMEYEEFRTLTALKAFEDLSDEHRRVLRREKTALLKQQDRFERLPPDVRDREIDDLILKDLAQSEAPPFEKWYLRRRAQQAMLPFETHEKTA
jgi:hypothetical protein